MSKVPKRTPIKKKTGIDDPILPLKNPEGYEDPFFIKKPEINQPDIKITPDPKKYPGNDWNDKPQYTHEPN